MDGSNITKASANMIAREKESKWYPHLIKACQAFINTIDNPISEDAHIDAKIQYEQLCRTKYERMKTFIERIEAVRAAQKLKQEEQL